MEKVLRMLWLGVLLVSLSGWGFLVHRTVNQLAIYRLPKGMQAFFFSGKEYLVRHSVRPDLRRNSDSTEATRHFIDVEAFGDSAAWKMPYDYPQALARYGRDSLMKYGYVPYQVMLTQQQLTRAFRNRDKDSILFYAADLSHYIADAHVPLHTTLNYDGQLTNQRGLHALWESVVPELELNSYDLYEKGSARYLQQPEQAIWNAVRGGYSLLGGVFGKEKEASLAFTDSSKYRIQIRNGREVRYYTTAFARAYGKLLGTTVNDQLKKSARLIADFWFTAWVDAGRPDLENLVKGGWSPVDRDRWHEERRAYQGNQLIQKSWLLSKQAGDNGGGSGN